ncbi:MAG: S41 family peptidase [Patescibacteria group bacterium]
MNTEEVARKNKQRQLARNLAVVIFGIVIAYSSFWVGYLTGRDRALVTKLGERVINTETGRPKEVDFARYWEAWSKLNEKAITSVPAEKMIQGSIAGLAASLGDPYTVFFTPEENKRFREDISGEFSGIGVEIIEKSGLPVIVAPLADSPAERSGLKAGDIIVAVDDAKTDTISLDETINRIRGDKGKPVKIKISRASETLDFEVTRETITVKSVSMETRESGGNKYAVIKIRQFGDDTDRLFGEIVSQIQASRPKGIVLDLRNNPGGYLEGAVDLAGNFLDGGVVVIEKGKDKKNKEYKTANRPKLKGYKLAVLVNKGSASASEIFAGAIQDRGAGRIIGEKTFGKGSVQEVVDLSDGSSIKVTVASWFTPHGRQINDEGIAPDIESSDDGNTPEDEVLERGLEYLGN